MFDLSHRYGKIGLNRFSEMYQFSAPFAGDGQSALSWYITEHSDNVTIPGSGASLRLPSLDALSPVSAAATDSRPGKDFRLDPLGTSGTLGGEAVPGGPSGFLFFTSSSMAFLRCWCIKCLM